MELLVDIKKKLPGFTLNVHFKTKENTLGLLGESGCGKSMTLKCIAGLVKPDRGRIVLNNRVLFDSEKGINLPIQERKIGFLFQNYALFPHMTVEQNVGYALKGYPSAEKDKIVSYYLEMMGICSLKKNFPHQLSGGQQQRTALARALAVNPEVLLLDEPFSALDNHLRSVMLKNMTETLSKYKGITIFVTHNMEEAYTLCENLAVISKGSIVSEGNKEELFTNPSSVASAVVTGCKNISKVNILSNNMIEAPDWNCKIETSKEIDPSVTHAGIRAHYIQLASDDGENIYNAWPSHTSETPFRRFVYLSLNNKPKTSTDYNLLWDISKEEWDDLKDLPLPWKIQLKEDFLILIKEK